MSYSTTQKVTGAAFAALVLGGIFLIVGITSKNWQEGEVTLDSILGKIVNLPFLIGDLQIAKVSFGVVSYCLEILEQQECFGYEDNVENPKKFLVARIASLLCIIISGLCVLYGLVSCCCKCGQKTKGISVAAFIAGASGIVALVVFATTNKADNIVLQQVTGLSYTWSFYLFAVGTGLVTLVAVVFYFTHQENETGQRATTSQQPQIYIVGK